MRSPKSDPVPPASGLSTGRVSLRERFAFAAGDIFTGGASSLINVVYLFFLTDVVGIRPGLAGTAILVAKLWDSVNDPLMGAISDRVSTRFGRRRPFILVGSLLIVAVMALLWLPTPPVTSQVGMTLWAIGSYICYNTVQTMMAVPYASLSTEISTDPSERDKANVLRLLFSTIASASITLTATRLVTGYRHGNVSSSALYTSLVLGFGLLFAVVMFSCAVQVRERVPAAPVEKLSLRTFVAPLRHQPFRVLMVMYLCHAISLDVVAATVLYYAAYVVFVNPTVFLGLFIAINLLAFIIANHLVKSVSKHLIYRTLMPLSLVAIWVVALYPSSWPLAGVYVAAACLAIGMAGAQLMPWVMLPDVLDAAEADDGTRSAGSFSGLMTFTRGVASSFAIFALGWVLDLAGYIKDSAVQPQPVVTAIRGIQLASIFTLLALGYVASRRYPLTVPVTRRNVETLAARRAREDS